MRAKVAVEATISSPANEHIVNMMHSSIDIQPVMTTMYKEELVIGSTSARVNSATLPIIIPKVQTIHATVEIRPESVISKSPTANTDVVVHTAFQNTIQKGRKGGLV
jgi:hypothetical protein